MVWFFRRQSVVRKRSVDELSATQPELARLLSKLGYAPQRTAETRRILAQLKASIKTQIPDFAAFQERIRLAARGTSDDPQPAGADREFLEEVLRAGNNEGAALAILDRDPVGQRLPFIERVPVKRGSGTAWLAPVEEPALVKLPADPPRFAELLNELQVLFRDPHPAVQDGVRVEVVEAIQRVRRELGRGSAYFLSAIQLLESRVTAYESSAGEPQIRILLQLLLKLIDDTECARSQTPASDTTRRLLRQAVERYLSQPKLYSRWMTNYFVDNLLAPGQIESASARSRQSRKTVELIRGEVAAGHYDAPEIARRLRALERDGLYFSSLVYVLLGFHDERLGFRVAGR